MNTAPPAPLLTVLCVWDDRKMPRSGPVNMAVDEALLMGCADTGLPVLRVYRWDRPTLSFGYFLSATEAAAACRPGEAMVRRWTGGGVVHHEGAVTWSLVVPPGEAFWQVRPAESYARLHEALARCLTGAEPGTWAGLREIRMAPMTLAAPAGGLCAEVPAPGDLLREGRKIAGAGQRRTRHGLLHQGVIFLPEAELPVNFPDRLAGTLAGEVRAFTAPVDWVVPVDRYSAAGWNGRC